MLQISRARLVRGRGAPVLAVDAEPVVAERGHELDEVGCHGAHVVVRDWVRRVADTTHVGHDAGAVGGQQDQYFAPVVGCLEDAVLEEGRAGTRGVVV